jgi:6,7-dimethyl-8-ribityllumazine synthase
MTVSSNVLTDTTGIHLTEDAFVVIVKTEWNTLEINELEAGCIRLLEANKVKHKTITVPGAFELPFAVNKYWQKLKEQEEDELLDEDFLLEIEKLDKFKPKDIHFPDAFVVLGCVIKGDTPHFDYVCAGLTQGIMQLNTTLPVPTIYGVLTVNNKEQAKERLGGVHGHKGEEAGAAAIKMIALVDSF